MATVTLAEDTLLGRPVALKRVYGAGDSQAMLRLKREALLGASLNHPNIVFVYDAALRDDGNLVIVMEYVEGETLADVIRSRGSLPPTEVTRVLGAVAAALDAIHERGIVHRDVKPANVLLGSDGSVKLADLGVAHVADRTHITSANAMVGSFSYMPPEQLDGAQPTPAMDIYALAAVAYEMLAGEKARPESNPLALAHAIATQPPPDLKTALPGTPAAAAGVLQRGMSADPGGRPSSASELVRRLESAYAPEQPTQDLASRGRPQPVVAPQPPGPKPPAGPAPRPSPAADRTAQGTRPRVRRSMLAPALLALAALAVIAVVIAATSGGGKNPSGAGTSTPHTSAGRPSTTASSGSAKAKTGTRANAHPATTTSSSPAAPSTATPPSSSSAATGTPPSSGGSSSTTGSSSATGGSTSATGGSSSATGGSSTTSPSGAVEQFYEAAANHQYAAAWALADPNLQSQLRGYASFQNTFSSVRAIAFHQAQVLAGSTSSTATVALRTTSVQTDRTQQCTGTARTVRTSAGGWLVDAIDINCG